MYVCTITILHTYYIHTYIYYKSLHLLNEYYINVERAKLFLFFIFQLKFVVCIIIITITNTIIIIIISIIFNNFFLNFLFCMNVERWKKCWNSYSSIYTEYKKYMEQVYVYEIMLTKKKKK